MESSTSFDFTLEQKFHAPQLQQQPSLQLQSSKHLTATAPTATSTTTATTHTTTTIASTPSATITTKPINLPQTSQATVSRKAPRKDTAKQHRYKDKCKLLELHIEETDLINKALRSELKLYKDKIEFEKKLQKYLINRANCFDSR